MRCGVSDEREHRDGPTEWPAGTDEMVIKERARVLRSLLYHRFYLWQIVEDQRTGKSRQVDDRRDRQSNGNYGPYCTISI